VLYKTLGWAGVERVELGNTVHDGDELLITAP